MIKRAVVSGASLVVLSSVAFVAPEAVAANSGAGRAPVPFSDARLKIEYNATDGDAGLQVFVDAEPWRTITITDPDGEEVLEVDADDVIRDYGLTELFSESSEPGFDEFPFEEFKRLFPEGRYTFAGRTIEGQRLRSTFRLSHTVLDGPQIVSPQPGATFDPTGVVVEWMPVSPPPGGEVVAYEVLVVADAPALGNPVRVLDVMLSASVTRFPVPAEFLEPGAYKTEVLAIDRNGNQTLTEVQFAVS